MHKAQSIAASAHLKARKQVTGGDWGHVKNLEQYLPKRVVEMFPHLTSEPSTFPIFRGHYNSNARVLRNDNVAFKHSLACTVNGIEYVALSLLV